MNQEEIKKRKHEYYLKNKEVYLLRAKKWIAQNKDKARASMLKSNKKYYQKNKHIIAEKIKQRNKLKPKKERERLSEEDKKQRRNAAARKYSKKPEVKAKRKEHYHKVKHLLKTNRVSIKKSPGQFLSEMKNKIIVAPNDERGVATDDE